MVLIRQVKVFVELNSQKLLPMFWNTQIAPEGLWLKCFVGVKILYLVLTAWLRACQVSSVPLAEDRVLKQMETCKRNTVLYFVFITCLLCHWIPSISDPLLIRIFLAYTSVLTHCLLAVGKTASAGSCMNSISRMHAEGAQPQKWKASTTHHLTTPTEYMWQLTGWPNTWLPAAVSVKMAISSHLF